MSGPAAMNTVGLTSQATGALIGAAGLFTNAAAAKRAADANAAYKRAQAADALQRGQLDVQKSNMQYRQLEGAQRASLAARGVVLTEGSPLEILASTEYMKSLDANTIKANAQREAYGFGVQAANYQNNANSISPWMMTTGSLLTSATAVADRWYAWKHRTTGVKAGS